MPRIVSGAGFVDRQICAHQKDVEPVIQFSDELLNKGVGKGVDWCPFQSMLQ